MNPQHHIAPNAAHGGGVISARRHAFFTKHPSLKKQSPMVWRIVGTYSNQLAYNKFAVFAFVSSLLVPNAAKLFRETRKYEKDWKRIKQRTQRNLLRDERLLREEERRINRLTDALLKSLRPERHQGGSVFPPPHWTGEPRPKAARRVRVRTSFPPADYLRYLVHELGYEGSAAIAALSRAHTPWTRVSDRRRATAFNADEQSEGLNNEHSAIAPAHPYYPVAPSRRTKVGGGLTERQVQKALNRKRWDSVTKRAVFEIVYRRRSTLEVSNESGRTVEVLYVYASRLRRDVRADLHDEENVA